jgi:anthranilate phosphoribosyltransferase
MSSMTSDFSWSETLTQLLEPRDLSVAQASRAMEAVMAGAVTDAQLAGFLVALRAKPETVDEIVGFRDAILHHAVSLPIDPMVLDIVGTGGDPYGAVVNVSSIASIVAASTGVPVVKHGNRAASSASGASDVLGALGLNLDLDPSGVARVFHQVGITFVFAAKFHPGFKYAASARKDMGIPSVFNILGPLCNPARPEATAVGVSDATRAPQVAGVFRTRGARGALVYRGDDGIDKLTTTGNSHVWEVSNGNILEHDINSVELGLAKARPEDLLGEGPEHNAQLAHSVLNGEPGPVRDIVILNAAAGLVAFALAEDPNQMKRNLSERLMEKIELAQSAVDQGLALAKLNEWVSATQSG